MMEAGQVTARESAMGFFSWFSSCGTAGDDEFDQLYSAVTPAPKDLATRSQTSASAATRWKSLRVNTLSDGSIAYRRGRFNHRHG